MGKGVVKVHGGGVEDFGLLFTAMVKLNKHAAELLERIFASPDP